MSGIRPVGPAVGPGHAQRRGRGWGRPGAPTPVSPKGPPALGLWLCLDEPQEEKPSKTPGRAACTGQLGGRSETERAGPRHDLSPDPVVSVNFYALLKITHRQRRSLSFLASRGQSPPSLQAWVTGVVGPPGSSRPTLPALALVLRSLAPCAACGLRPLTAKMILQSSHMSFPNLAPICTHWQIPPPFTRQGN